jgi:hypothetical protein
LSIPKTPKSFRQQEMPISFDDRDIMLHFLANPERRVSIALGLQELRPWLPPGLPRVQFVL